MNISQPKDFNRFFNRYASLLRLELKDEFENQHAKDKTIYERRKIEERIKGNYRVLYSQKFPNSLLEQ